MLRILKDKWAENEALLCKKIGELDLDCYYMPYKDVVKLAFDTIYNNGEDISNLVYPYCEGLDCDHITVVDNGDYQGTQLFLIPFKTYQPPEYAYLMTHVGYGSCSGCDTLQSILQGYSTHEQKISSLLHLCRDLVVNAIKPYNDGWRYSNAFDQVKIEEEKENA